MDNKFLKKIIAQSPEDLQFISACCSEAKVKISDIKYLSSNKIFLLSLSINFTYGVEPDEILLNKNQELRARNISKNIRCMVCQNQSIDDSNAPLAKDLRILIRNKIKDGKNDKEMVLKACAKKTTNK